MELKSFTEGLSYILLSTNIYQTSTVCARHFECTDKYYMVPQRAHNLQSQMQSDIEAEMRVFYSAQHH